jgi:hypothetical protein
MSARYFLAIFSLPTSHARGGQRRDGFIDGLDGRVERYLGSRWGATGGSCERPSSQQCGEPLPFARSRFSLTRAGQTFYASPVHSGKGTPDRRDFGFRHSGAAQGGAVREPVSFGRDIVLANPVEPTVSWEHDHHLIITLRAVSEIERSDLAVTCRSVQNRRLSRQGRVLLLLSLRSIRRSPKSRTSE